MKAAFRAVVHGLVQGVFFRAFVLGNAREMELTGFVHNLPDGTVEVVAEGEKDKLGKLLGRIGGGPPAARVTDVEVEWLDYSGNYPRFSVR